MIHITDLNGCKIEVTNLDEAIEQTKFFKDCHHVPPIESDKERQAYWTDMHQKLLELKKQMTSKTD